MISIEDQKRIIRVTANFWNEEVKSSSFQSIFGGKEIGHRIADYVDEQTSDLLTNHFTTGFQRNSKGRKNARSMGDVWIHSKGIFNPLNVKAGEFGKDGQPNLVALNKVLRALLNRYIDSYYLLIIKIQVDENESEKSKKLTPKIFFVDMLDHLDVVTFDSGPGQIMLKEKFFYEKMRDIEIASSIPIEKKIARLIDLKKDGDKRLFENREKNSLRLAKLASQYEKSINKSLDQGALNIG
jgi:hypothetical protein